MKTNYSVILLAWLATTLLLTACGGGSGGSGGGTGIYNLSGQFQKGPFAIGSQVSVNELDENLYPTGIVYNVQTSDDLGKFSVPTKIGKHLVEIVGDGFYMDELTGQLSSTRIQLRAVADLNIHSIVTVNILTSLQSQRLKALLLQGSAYAAANTQSQNEVLAAFGIDHTKVNSLSTLYSMAIDGTTDADSVLLAVSTILSKMATNAAIANSTSQPAELSNYVNTIASQISYTGTITQSAIITARNLAETQIDLAAVRANIETYYANRGVTIVAPKFEEWVDKSNSGTLPQRLVPVSGLTFTSVTGASPGQLITSNPITVAGLGAGVAAPVTVSVGTTIIKNNVAVSGLYSEVQNGDIIAMRVTSLGYGLTNTSTISVGSTSTTWAVTSQLLGGTISGLTGTGLVLQNNGGNNITIPAGSTSFSFSTAIANGTNYNVSVLTLPASPLLICDAINGSGTVGASPSNISVVCAKPSGFALVANGSGTISVHAISATTGALSAVAGSPFATDRSTRQVTVDPIGKFIYVALSDGGVSAYNINAATGALSAIPGSPFADGLQQPYSITVDPTGKFVYTANHLSNSVSAFSINTATGALSAVAGSPYAGAARPISITVDPTGKFVYTANFDSNNVSAYTINATTGALATVAGSPFGMTGTSLYYFVTADPSGKFIYTANYYSNDVSAYTINATTGALATVAGSPFAAGALPISVTVDPTGKFVYVTNSNDNNISAYTINVSSGALTAISGSPFAAGASPTSVTVDPTGKFAYVANASSNNVSVYSIDSATGALIAISGSPFASGTNPLSITIMSLP